MISPLTNLIISTINSIALNLGIDKIGLADVSSHKFNDNHLKDWLRDNYHGSMSYLSRSVEKRLNPELLLPNVQTIIVIAQRYYPVGIDEKKDPRGQVARFAWGADYHAIIQDKLKCLCSALTAQFGENYQTKYYCDTGPVLEKYWACRAGLGWIGKNTLLITPEYGSWVNLGIILWQYKIADELTNLSFVPNTHAPIPSAPLPGCANCSACLSACPTGALINPYRLNATQCIAYQTIETKPRPSQPIHGWIYGCDLCQEPCPWNGIP